MPKAKANNSTKISNRKLKQSKYKTLRLQKKISSSNYSKLPSSFVITKNSLLHLKKYWKPFFILMLIYAILTIIFVRSIGGNININELKSSLSAIIDSGNNQFSSSLILFGILIGNSGSTGGDLASMYQTILIIIFSLSIIWGLRQSHSQKTFSAKNSLYQGMYPLIPFILVLIIVGLQLIPLAIGTSIYTTVIGGGLAVTTIEKFLWFLFFALTLILTLYMICSSLFALYIVTLPNMTPMKALRSARELVKFRRWTIMRKILMLPLLILSLFAIIIIPLIIFATVLAQFVFFILGVFSILLMHTYMYELYREML